MARVRNFWCHLLNFEPQVKRTYYNVSSLLFFLELKLLMPPLCLAFFRDARMASLYFVAFPHCFLCSGGEFWWFFSSAPWALCQLSPSPRVCAVWSCSHFLGLSVDRALGSPMAASEACEGGNIPSLLLQLSPCWLPTTLPSTLASQALAVARDPAVETLKLS